MNIIIDLIIIAIIAFSTFTAYKKGLISLALGLVSFIIAVFVTVILYKPISNFVINATFIDEMLENTIYEKSNDIMEENTGNEISNKVVDSAKENILPETARTLSINIVQGGVFLILIICVRIALRFVSALANFVAKMPIIEQFNKAGGLIYGVLRGLLIIYMALLLISIFAKIAPENDLYQNIETSYLGKTMYENNILNIIFKSN